MKEEILSVGIDIGTTTTQITFSKISLQNTASLCLVPEVKITKKEVIYKSKIYFTPLVSKEKIDLLQIKKIISEEYAYAGIDKNQISIGAIIITGETARKDNAEEVLNALSQFAGDFVVATAGPALEAILAGFGAGASEASKKYTSKVINFDIGGGTTNAAVFWEGEVIDAFALDLGGRLLKLNNSGTITYISPKIQKLIEISKLNIILGKKPSFSDLKLLTDTFAKIFIKIIYDLPMKSEYNDLFIDHIPKENKVQLIMFSGGVAEFIYNSCEINSLEETIVFGDIGPLLGFSIREAFKEIKLLEPKEKIRATVIGAGSHSLKLSGSTTIFDDSVLPIKNVPIIKLSLDENNLEAFHKQILAKKEPYEASNTAIAFKGPKSPTYLQIKNMAVEIVKAYDNSSEPILVIVENDFAKALGQTIKNIVKNSKAVICLDNIKVDNGDYVDIGKPVANVIPVVVKTLIFKN